MHEYFFVSGLPQKPTAVLYTVKVQVQYGWTMLIVWDPKQGLRIVTMVVGGLTTVVMKRIYQSAALQVRNIFSSLEDNSCKKILFLVNQLFR